MSQKEKDNKVYEHEKMTREDAIHILMKSPEWERMNQKEKQKMIHHYEALEVMNRKC